MPPADRAREPEARREPEGLHASAVRELGRWRGADPQQESLRESYLAHLAEHPDGMWRACRAGHLTASAIIVDPVRERVLLTLHPTVGRWLQTGGHCEPADVSLRDAASREAREESGIADISVVAGITRLDRHAVLCREGSASTRLHHLDVQYAIVAPPDSVPVRSSESVDLRWWPWDALPEPTDASVRLLVAAARAQLMPSR